MDDEDSDDLHRLSRRLLQEARCYRSAARLVIQYGVNAVHQLNQIADTCEARAHQYAAAHAAVEVTE